MEIHDSIVSGIQLPKVEKEITFVEHCRALSELDHDSGASYFARKLQGWDGARALAASQGERARARYIDRTLTRDQTKALDGLAHAGPE